MSCGQNATHEIFSHDSARNHAFMVALTLYLNAYSKKQIRNRSQIKKITGRKCCSQLSTKADNSSCRFCGHFYALSLKLFQMQT